MSRITKMSAFAAAKRRTASAKSFPLRAIPSYLVLLLSRLGLELWKAEL